MLISRYTHGRPKANETYNAAFSPALDSFASCVADTQEDDDDVVIVGHEPDTVDAEVEAEEELSDCCGLVELTQTWQQHGSTRASALVPTMTISGSDATTVEISGVDDDSNTAAESAEALF